ncbi:MAG: hypothetical protein U1D06_01155 [Paracoccaceae bacterium]|nr:hypothetical protein [Paracoccaceae bacterium]
MAELHWLYDCFEAFNAAHGPLEGEEYQNHLQSTVITRDRMLGWLENGHTPSQIVAGVRSALSDCSGAMRFLPKDNPAKGAALHANYFAIRGRSLEDDIALSKEVKP